MFLVLSWTQLIAICTAKKQHLFYQVFETENKTNKWLFCSLFLTMGRLWCTCVFNPLKTASSSTQSACIATIKWPKSLFLQCWLTFRDCLWQRFSTARLRPGTGPWLQVYRAARGSPGICHFSFLRIFQE